MTKANGAKGVLCTKIGTNIPSESMGAFTENRLQNYGDLGKVSHEAWFGLIEAVECMVAKPPNQDDDLRGYLMQFINRIKTESNQ